MPRVKTYSWNMAEHIQTKQEILEYLSAASEDGDPHLIKAVWSDIIQSPAWQEILGQETDGNPSP